MNITIFGLYSYFSPHFEVELELLKVHLDKGDSLSFITCDAVLQYCEPNSEHLFRNCLLCMGRSKGGLDLLNGRVKLIALSELILPIRHKLSVLNAFIENTISYDGLKTYKINNFEIGSAVLSNLNDFTRESRPDPSRYHQKTCEMLSSALACYYAVLFYLEESDCDEMYLFNGRFANMRGALRACERSGVPFTVHERGADMFRYSLFKNDLPHNIEVMLSSLKSTLFNVPKDKKYLLADKFYTERMKGVPSTFVPYIEGQRKGLLLDGITGRKSVISAFTSTEYEFASLQELVPKTIYASQLEGLLAILRDLDQKQFTGVFVVRTHPNSHGSSSDFSGELLKLKYKFLRVLVPSDPVDTYALLYASDKVITFGSTMGIESAYWGKPSILAGWALYKGWGSTYDPTNHDEVMNLLLTDLKPLPTDGAIDFGYASRVFGIELQHVQPIGLWSGLFEGKKVTFSKDLTNVWSMVNDPDNAKAKRLFDKWDKERLNFVYNELNIVRK